MNKYNFHVEWSDGDEGYIATCPAFPRISGFGDTPEEALAEVEVALELAVEAAIAHGRPLPEPTSLKPFSGKFQLRVPKQLHAQLVRQAEAEGVSLNTLAVSYLSEAVGATQAGAQLAGSHAEPPQSPGA
jgi:antitoxin HicB